MRHVSAMIALAVLVAGCGRQPPALVEKAEVAPAEAKPASAALAENLVHALEDASPAKRDQAAAALKEMGADAVPALRTALSGGPATRCRVAALLKEMEQEAPQPISGVDEALAEAAQAMRADLKSPAEAVRLSAAETLGTLDDPALPAVPDLAALLKDPSDAVRTRAAWAIGHLGEGATDGVPALIEALARDKSVAVRTQAAEALGGVRAEGKESIAALAAALKDSEPGVREQSLESLSQFGMPAVPALIDAAKLPELSLRKRALDIFFDLGEDAKAAVPTLIVFLKDDDGDVRRLAAQALKKIDPAAAQQAGVP